jgi:predicted dehydrogenase
MKIALLGTGFGLAHAAIYAERDVEVVVFGRTPARLEDVQQKFGFPTTTDLDGLYDDPSIDLIDVCLPTALHAEHVLRGLAAGKHVLCELPLALTVADAQRVAEAAAANDRQVFVDMSGRFSPVSRLLHEATTGLTYGQLQTLEIELGSALLWPGYDLRLDTIVLDMLHGSLDTVVQVLGVPDSMATTAVTGADHGSAVQAVFTYPDALARVSGSSLMPQPYGVRGGYRATFTGGVLEHTFTAGFTGQVANPVVHEYTEDGHRELAAEGPDAYTAVIDHVLACLRGQADNQLATSSVLDSLRLTLDVHTAVNRG